MIGLLDKSGRKRRVEVCVAQIDRYPKWLWRFLVSRACRAQIFGLTTLKYIDDIWVRTEEWNENTEIRNRLTQWEIANNAYLGRTLFLDKIDLHFEDTQKQLALESYKNFSLDGCVGFLRKGIDGFITTTLGIQKQYGLPYRVRVLEDTAGDITLLGARLAAGSPRVYVEIKNGNEYEAIRVSIDPNAPKILDGDEADCPGANFSKIFEFIKLCYQPLIDHWDGKIDSHELRERVQLAMSRNTGNRGW